MKNKINCNIKKMLTYTMTLSVSLVLAACADTIDILSSGDANDEGNMTLQIPLSFSEPNTSTRALPFPKTNDEVALQDVWIGIYNKDTGARLASYTKNLGGNTYGATHTQGVVIDVPVSGTTFFNNQYPEAYIVGVANYAGITDKDGNSLKEQLEAATTWEEYIKISVDATSAEQSEYALMSGMYNWSASGTHHNNNTVDYTGLPYYKEQSTVKLKNEKKQVVFDGENYKNGAIHLRRLYSQMNVKVIAGDGIEISNLSWQVFNIPTAVFLQERTTVKPEDVEDENDWNVKTPNVADLMEEGKGYGESISFGVETEKPTDAGIYDTHFSLNNNGKAIDVDEEGNYTFNFWHYENKHWGVEEECKGYDDREKSTKNGDVPVIYTSLCPEGTEYNNNASYFVITADVTDNNVGITGKVQYLIHEGYVNDDTGTRNEGEPCDFSCFRNTTYTYTININGMNNIMLNAAAKDGVAPKPGVSGVINGEGQGIIVTTYEYDATGNTAKIYLSDEQCASLQWRIYEPAEADGSDPTDFGSWDVGSIISCNNGQWKDTNNSYRKYSDENKGNEFLNRIKIAGSDNIEYSLIEFIANAQKSNNAKTRTDANGNDTKEYTIKLPVNNSTYKGVPADGARYLYLYTPIGYSANNSTCNNPLYGFAQQPQESRQVLIAPALTAPTDFVYAFTPCKVTWNWSNENDKNNTKYLTLYANDKEVQTNIQVETAEYIIPYEYLQEGNNTFSIVAHPATDDYIVSNKSNISLNITKSKSWDFGYTTPWIYYVDKQQTEFDSEDYLILGANFFTKPTSTDLFFNTGGSSKIDDKTGLPTSRFFKFTIPANTITTGKITVKAGNNGKSTVDYKSVAVKVGTNDAKIYYAGYQAATALTHSFDISDQTDADVDVYIYTTSTDPLITTDPNNAINGNLRIYSITYSPN